LNPNRAKLNKTKPNQKKPSQTKNQAKIESNQKTESTGFCPKKSNRTETGWFEPVLVFLIKKFG